jgi:hypothetical protein
MDEVLQAYFDAWNEPDPDKRARLLGCCLTEAAEQLDPIGRWRGIDGFVERIGRYHEAAPGTRIVPASGVDAHNHVSRYAWQVVNEEGASILEGLDVVERANDGRLKRVLMFYGPLPAA